jgi:hypothetical protein
MRREAAPSVASGCEAQNTRTKFADARRAFRIRTERVRKPTGPTSEQGTQRDRSRISTSFRNDRSQIKRFVLTYCRTPSDCAGGNNRSIASDRSRKLNLGKLADAVALTNLTTTAAELQDPQNQRKLRGNKSLSTASATTRGRAAPVCWLKTNDE